MLLKNAIPREEKELYRYGIQQGMVAFLNFGSTMVLGAIFGQVWESLLFMGAYIPLRSFAGGYHAKTAKRCYFFSVVMMIAILWVIRTGVYSPLVCGCLISICGSIIYGFAPVEDRNKPLDGLEKVVYRCRTRKVLLAEMLFSFVSLLFVWKRVVLCMTLVLCVLAVMLLLGQWKNRDLRRKISTKTEG